jgi:hypothetical protein
MTVNTRVLLYVSLAGHPFLLHNSKDPFLLLYGCCAGTPWSLLQDILLNSVNGCQVQSHNSAGATLHFCLAGHPRVCRRPCTVDTPSRVPQGAGGHSGV